MQEAMPSLLKLLQDSPSLPAFCFHTAVLGDAHQCTCPPISGPVKDVAQVPWGTGSEGNIESEEKRLLEMVSFEPEEELDESRLNMSLPPLSTCKDVRYLLSSTPLRKVSTPHNLGLDSSYEGEWSFSMATPPGDAKATHPYLAADNSTTTTETSTCMDESLLDLHTAVCQQPQSCEKITTKVLLRGGERPLARALFPHEDSLGVDMDVSREVGPHLVNTPVLQRQRIAPARSLQNQFKQCFVSPMPSSPLVSQSQPNNHSSEYLCSPIDRCAPNDSLSLVVSPSVATASSHVHEIATPMQTLDEGAADAEGSVSCSQELFSPEIQVTSNNEPQLEQGIDPTVLHSVLACNQSTPMTHRAPSSQNCVLSSDIECLQDVKPSVEDGMMMDDHGTAPSLLGISGMSEPVVDAKSTITPMNPCGQSIHHNQSDVFDMLFMSTSQLDAHLPHVDTVVSLPPVSLCASLTVSGQPALPSTEQVTTTVEASQSNTPTGLLPHCDSITSISQTCAPESNPNIMAVSMPTETNTAKEIERQDVDQGRAQLLDTAEVDCKPVTVTKPTSSNESAGNSSVVVDAEARSTQPSVSTAHLVDPDTLRPQPWSPLPKRRKPSSRGFLYPGSKVRRSLRNKAHPQSNNTVQPGPFADDADETEAEPSRHQSGDGASVPSRLVVLASKTQDKAQQPISTYGKRRYEEELSDSPAAKMPRVDPDQEPDVSKPISGHMLSASKPTCVTSYKLHDTRLSASKLAIKPATGIGHDVELRAQPPTCTVQEQVPRANQQGGGIQTIAAMSVGSDIPSSEVVVCNISMANNEMQTVFHTPSPKTTSCSSPCLLSSSKAAVALQSKATHGQIGNTISDEKEIVDEILSVAKSPSYSPRALRKVRERVQTTAPSGGGMVDSISKAPDARNSPTKVIPSFVSTPTSRGEPYTFNQSASNVVSASTEAHQCSPAERESNLPIAPLLIESSSSLAPGRITASLLTGFVTASGHSINISVDALEKAEREEKECVKSAALSMDNVPTSNAMSILHEECKVTLQSASVPHNEVQELDATGLPQIFPTPLPLKALPFQAPTHAISTTPSSRNFKAPAITSSLHTCSAERALSSKKKVVKTFKAPRLASSVSKQEEQASLARIMKSLRSSGVQLDVPSCVISPANMERPVPVSVPSGFSTAGSKKQNISLSMQRTQSSLADDKENGILRDARSPSNIRPEVPGLELTCQTPTLTSCVQTSIGRPPIVPSGSTQHSSERVSVGFQTASGKSLSVSLHSLKSVVSTHEDVPSSPTPLIHKPRADSVIPSLLTGFHTASGSAVLVSSQSLEKAHKLVSDGNEIQNDEKHVLSPPMSRDELVSSVDSVSRKNNAESPSSVVNFLKCQPPLVEKPASLHSVVTGFHTASGRPISVYDESLHQVKALVETTDESICQHVPMLTGHSLSAVSCDETSAAHNQVDGLAGTDIDNLSTFTQINFGKSSPKKADFSHKDCHHVSSTGTNNGGVSKAVPQCEAELSSSQPTLNPKDKLISDVESLDTAHGGCFLSTQVVRHFFDFSMDEREVQEHEGKLDFSTTESQEEEPLLTSGNVMDEHDMSAARDAHAFIDNVQSVFDHEPAEICSVPSPFGEAGSDVPSTSRNSSTEECVELVPKQEQPACSQVSIDSPALPAVVDTTLSAGNGSGSMNESELQEASKTSLIITPFEVEQKVSSSKQHYQSQQQETSTSGKLAGGTPSECDRVTGDLVGDSSPDVEDLHTASGLQTARGKPVEVSRKSIRFVCRQLHCMDSFQSGAADEETSTSSCKERLSERINSGLQTGNGMAVHVSQEALSAVRQKLNTHVGCASGREGAVPEVSLQEEREPGPSSPTWLHCKPPLPTSSPLQSKSASVLGTSLEADHMCSVNQPQVTPALSHLQPSTSTSSVLHTASGKAVEVSEDALNAARRALGVTVTAKSCHHSHLPLSVAHSDSEKERRSSLPSVVETPSNTQASWARPTSSSFPGLQTASGKVVEITNSSLQAARRTLHEDDSENGPSFTMGAGASFRGLMTAAGERVEVSETAVRAARSTLDGDCSEKWSSRACEKRDGTPQKVPSAPLSAFTTAGGKSVHISESALRAVQQTSHRDTFSTVPSVLSHHSTADPASRRGTSSTPVPMSCNVLLSSVPTSSFSTPFAFTSTIQSTHTSLAVTTSTITPVAGAVHKVKYKPVFKPSESGTSEATTETVPCVRGTLSSELAAPPSHQQQVQLTRGITTNPEAVLSDRSGRRPLVPVQSFLDTSGSYIRNTPVQRYSLRSLPPSQTFLHHSSSTNNTSETIPQAIPTCTLQATSAISMVTSTPLIHTTSTDGKSSPFTGQGSFTNPRRQLKLSTRSSTPFWRRHSSVQEVTATANIIPPGTLDPPCSAAPLSQDGMRKQSALTSGLSLSEATHCSEAASPCTSTQVSGSPPAQFLPQPSLLSSSPIDITLSQVCAMESSPVREPELTSSKWPVEDSGYQTKTDLPVLKSPHASHGVCSGAPSPLAASSPHDAAPELDSPSYAAFLDAAQDSLNDSLHADIADTEYQAVGADLMMSVCEKRAPCAQPLTVADGGRPSASPIARTSRSTSSTSKSSSSQLHQQRRRVPLQVVVGHQLPGGFSEEELYSLGVHLSVMNVSAANAASFHFYGAHFFSAVVLSGAPICVGDGAVLTLSSGSAGVEQFWEAFVNCPEVDAKLVGRDWFVNHYRWVVWKLAALEVAFPHKFAGRCLSPDHLMQQLRHRYHREIDGAERPAIRKICEQDDIPSRTMVLCVSAIHPDRLTNNNLSRSTVDGSLHKTGEADNSAKSVESETLSVPCIELTDGWYSLPAILDPPLKHQMKTGKIAVGVKLMIYGAVLVEGSGPCHPLEAPSSLTLKVSANSTRRARWFAKLGYQPSPQPFKVSLASVFSDGGLVGCVEVLIARAYPLIYMEKTLTGRNVFRNARSEEKAAAGYEAKRQAKVDTICSRVRKGFEDEIEQHESRKSRRRSRRLNTLQIKQLQDGEEIYNALANAADPAVFQELLSRTQRTLLESYIQSLRAERQTELQRQIEQAMAEAEDELPPTRSVVPLLRVHVVPLVLSSPTSTHCILSVWRPGQEVVELLAEGRALRVYNLTGGTGRYQKSQHVQLTASRATRYEQLPSAPSLLPSSLLPRQCQSIGGLPQEGNRLPFAEFDTVGISVCKATANVAVGDGSTLLLETVYFSDAEGHMVAVKVWEGLKSLGIADLVVPGALVSISNLSYRGLGPSCPHPQAQASDVTVFSLNPCEAHLRVALQHLKSSLPDDKTTFLQLLEDEIQISI